MNIDTLVLGPFQVNCYLLFCDDGQGAALVDPGDDAARIIRAVGDRSVSHIFLTHAHIDHIGAVAELQRRFKAQVVLDERELPLLENAGRQAEMFGLPAPESFVPDQYAQDNSLFSFAGETVQVLCTPGHSPGGLSFLAGDRVFTGDALFYDSIGRTDLHGGSAMVLLHSIQTRLFILPGHTQVFPGHGPATTIDRERRCNPFF